jgi:4-diphosphocytidyl-2-C-methyl-D-erythritol kinase
LTLTSSGIPIPLNENNLIYHAFRVFQKSMHPGCGLEVQITKRIPTGAGLGGGSSNAAATLIAMNRLWDSPLSTPDLEFMAAEIGSDVPFFIQGGTAVGEGRGERLTPIDLQRDYWVLLVCPTISVSTAWAYSQARIGLTKDEKLTKFRSIFQKNALRSLRGSLDNDLEEVVFKRHPLLGLFKEDLYKWDAFYASMSGSGSSVYGLFEHLDQAEAARSFFHVDKRVTTFLCRPISSSSPEVMVADEDRQNYRLIPM